MDDGGDDDEDDDDDDDDDVISVGPVVPAARPPSQQPASLDFAIPTTQPMLPSQDFAAQSQQPQQQLSQPTRTGSQ
jgi:hypothetical protein